MKGLGSGWSRQTCQLHIISLFLTMHLGLHSESCRSAHMHAPSGISLQKCYNVCFSAVGRGNELRPFWSICTQCHGFTQFPSGVSVRFGVAQSQLYMSTLVYQSPTIRYFCGRKFGGLSKTGLSLCGFHVMC